LSVTLSNGCGSAFGQKRSLEERIENPFVGGSIPPRATKKKSPVVGAF